MNEIEKRIHDLSNVVNDPKKHLLYYRHSLADGERMDIPARTIEDKGCVFPAQEPVPEKAVNKLFDKLSKEQRFLEVLYCPLIIKTPMRDGARSDALIIYPYWIPAVIDRAGALYTPDDESEIPWLVRGVLEPNDYLPREYPVLSSVEKVDQTGGTLKIPRDSWQQYLAGAYTYFKDQTGYEVAELELDGWIVQSDQTVLVPAEIGGLREPILNFYNHFLDESTNQLPGALKSLLTPRISNPEAIHDPVITEIQTQHFGQMANRFPLSPSQRISLALLNKTQRSQTFAVNGPPGTGKTTLIQSIVADAIVKSFLAEERPPIILGSSANNKAITNILDSFASVTPSEEYRTGLNERWLPDLTVLGHYLAANNAEKLDQARNAGYWVTNAGKTGADAYRDYCNQHSRETCTEYLLGRFKAYQKDTDLDELKGCYNYIQNRAVGLVSHIDHVMLAISKVLAILEDYDYGVVPVVTLPIAIKEHIDTLRTRRVFIETLWAQEHLRIIKPGFFFRLLDRIRFGNPAVRRARIQSAIIQKPELNEYLNETDLYQLSESLWKQRETDFQQEVKLSQVLNENTPHFEALAPYLSDIQKDIPASSQKWIEHIQEKLDTGERHEAFWWALHGLECKWLIQRDDESYRKLNTGESQSIKRWEQRAFLTPVFVSTFFSLPRFFSYSKMTPQETWIYPPLSELLDLLVIDEAGQVAPEIGLPAFGLAKKAVVVGDVHQLEPIWNIVCESIDFSNCKRAGFITEKQAYERFSRSNRSSFNGSLMALAQDASSFIYPPDWNEAGALLVEHRRCAPPIIEYCNQFVYKSLLEIKTTLKPTDLPALGYCHIGGESRKHHTSQSNPVEARAIAAWIRSHKEQLLKRYNTNLAAICAIVTPFRGQQSEIITALRNEGVYEKGLVVGTVHTLQGAEKPLVIFSPVYGRNHTSQSLFFNQSYNMLNVAISRAKDHFLVFGNMALFKSSDTHSPASDLGRLLFQNEESQLPNDFIFSEDRLDLFEQEPVERISELQKHRSVLKKAIETAEKRLVIVSPFISIQALTDDRIPELLFEAVQRNVEVIIYTDAHLDMVKGSLKPHAEAGRKALIETGATLQIMSGIHNKTVIVDRKVLIEGSFNWLSAVRDEQSPYHRRETSIVLQYPHCERFITRAEQEMGINTSISV